METSEEIVACLRMAVLLPSDPRHKMTLSQAAYEIERLRKELAAERERFNQMEAQWADACADASREMKRAEKAESTLAAIRTDLDTYHRDPGHCDLAWLVTRVQGHVGYEPEETTK